MAANKVFRQFWVSIGKFSAWFSTRPRNGASLAARSKAAHRPVTVTVARLLDEFYGTTGAATVAKLKAHAKREGRAVSKQIRLIVEAWLARPVTAEKPARRSKVKVARGPERRKRVARKA